MGEAEVQLREYRPTGLSGWAIAWLVMVPLIVALAYAKVARALASMTWTSVGAIDDSSLRGILSWLWGFTSLRFAGALVVALLVQRWLLPGRRWLVLPLGAGLFSALALAVGFARPHDHPFSVLAHWTNAAAEQFHLMAACLWRDAIIVSLCVLVLGLAIQVCGPRTRKWLVRCAQAAAVIMALLVAIDYTQELATGLATNTRVLAFGLLNPADVALLISQEATPYRAGVLAAVALLCAAWTIRTRGLARAPIRRDRMAPLAPAAAALGSFGLLLPVPSSDVNQRDTASTLYTLARTALPVPEDRIRADVMRDFDRTGQARWSSAELRLVPVDAGRPRNLVVVMLESMRAKSTTMHSPGLATTPFLASIASKGLLVEDMSAVIPRTAAAWIAILAGHYPLTNEGTAIWAAERGRGAPEMRGLPGALGSLGYATAFFSPAHIELLNDRELLQALGFESMFTHKDLGAGDEPDANYFGPADEVMVDPVLEWTRRQIEQGKPFMKAIMTNVGHHPFEPPDDWPMIEFGESLDRRLNSYYNCLRYVDGVVQRLMRGYEALGVLEDTVFLFVGDHGQMFGEHRLWQSFNSIYEPALRVPAIVYAPGRLPGGRAATGTRQQVDLFPTMVELLGLRAEGARLPGVSLLEPVAPDRTIFFSTSIESTYLGMRRGQRKYIYSFERDPIAVYDLARDAPEAAPLASVSSAELEDARRTLIEWKAQAETSAYGHPARSYRPAGSWAENLRQR